MIKKLYFDSDGIGANWRGYVQEFHLGDMSIEEFNSMDAGERSLLMQRIYRDDPHLFYMLDPLPQFIQLIEGVNELGIPWEILTAGSPDHPDNDVVVSDKKAWFQENFGIDPNNVIVVEDSFDKVQYAGEGVLLVDDFRRNCDEFENAGGRAVYAEAGIYNPVDVLQEIKKYLV